MRIPLATGGLLRQKEEYTGQEEIGESRGAIPNGAK